MVSIKKRRVDKHELINSVNVSSPVALALTGATALRGLVARTGASSAASGKIPGCAHAYRGYSSARSGRPDQVRQAPPPGKSPVALTLTGATALRGLVARTGASSAASGEIPGCAYRGYGSARSGSPDRRVKRRLRENPRSRSRLPGLQFCAVW